MIALRLSCSLLALTSALAATGCSKSLDELPREPVAGTVLMDGQPLPGGVIQFYPKGEATASSAGANGEIVYGKFSIPREAGPVPGTYKVSISHAELTANTAKGKGKKVIAPSRSKKIGPEQIPARYNTQSTLEAVIKAGGTPDLEYKLESK